MISIVLPIYNYNITSLLEVLEIQLSQLNISYEIVCCEDASTKYIKENNNAIVKIANARHLVSKINNGRITTRQLLAKKANYDWLLFLDADVIPKSDNFLQRYKAYLDSNYDAIYGGYYYHNIIPKEEFSLRWNYGKNYEQVDAKKRNNSPYKITISGNFMIRKSVFLNINNKIENDGYGYDNYFGLLMKINDIKVFHINNEVYHNGLDTNTVFLNKVEKAVETIAQLYKKQPDFTTENTLLEFYKKLKSLGLTKPTKWFFKQFKSAIRRQLLSPKPNLKLLQFYKLGYLCTIISRSL